MRVDLINKEELKDFFKTWGQFSCKCYNTPEKYADRVGRACLESEHYSGSRSVMFKFNIEGISRACSHQLVRHGLGTAINQRSQRYCAESDVEFVIPPFIGKDELATAMYLDAVDEAQKAYNRIVKYYVEEKGMSGEKVNQAARYLLPNATPTELTMGFTLEALMNFCNKRLCTRAEWEIRTLANLMVAEVLDILPELAVDLVPICEKNLYCPESKKHACGKAPLKDEVLLLLDYAITTATKGLEEA